MAIITREQGASVLNVAASGQVRFKSDASLIVDSGASLHSFGHAQVESGASLNVNDGASLTVKPSATTVNTVYELLSAGNNKIWYMAGSGASPVFAASPGDLCWVAHSASTSIWLNVSDGTGGSRWDALVRTDATSGTLGAR